MIFASVQMNSRDDKKVNLKNARKFIDQAADSGAKVVTLPEMFNYLGPDDKKRENAEEIPGPTIESIKDKARKLDIYVLAGSIPEKVKGKDRLFNTSVLINPEGDIIAKYRKLHMFDIDIEGQPTYRESSLIQPGEDVVTVETEIGTFGLSICYDLRFPELYRRLTKEGAQIVFLPAAFTLHTGKDHWESLVRARAIENQLFFIASGQIGYHPPERECYGNSMIVDPWGTVLARATNRPGVTFVDVDMSYQNKIRKELPCLDHTREEVFKI